MEKRILFILVLVLSLSFYSKALASDLCSSDGYTILTVNGIFNNKVDAIKNRDNLKNKFGTSYHNELLIIDYLYNPTHLAGVGDLIDAVQQGVFSQKEDYDLTEMLDDASQKIKTQKVLLVAHSQGNFYSNNFYDKVASQEGGVPKESIGMYGVASPADRVAGGGSYVTSDTDQTIAGLVSKFISILPPNVHIKLKAEDGNGHSFSNVYLKYQGERIISDIKHSLDKLKENDEQEPGDPCISPPDISIRHRVTGVVLAVADPTAVVLKEGAIGAYHASVYITNEVRDFGLAVGDSLRNIFLATGKMLGNLSANVIDSFSGEGGDLGTGSQESSESEIEIVLEPGTPSVVKTETSKENPVSEDSPIGQGDDSTQIEESELTQIVPSDIPPEVPLVEENKKEEVVKSPEPIVTYGSGSSGGGGGGGSPAPDTRAPIISITGSNPVDAIKDSLYADAGATALDDVDGVISSVTSGTVDTTTLGVYTVTYTATDLAGNVGIATRTVNVVTTPPPDPLLDTTPPVITVLGNTREAITKDSTYVDAGATANDAVDGDVLVLTSGAVDTSVLGSYVLTYTASDIAGNVSTASRTVQVSSLVYIPKYSFGKGNGDSRDWQVWSFNGSNVYDWSNNYVDNYLRQQFKIQAYAGGIWCSQCLQVGVFSHDPQSGFETSDIIYIGGLDANPQNNMNGVTYDVVIKWDSTGYTYTILDGLTVVSTGHTNVVNINDQSWVSWDGSQNNFTRFPSGDWQDVVYNSPLDRVGGSGMMLQPFPIYQNQPTYLMPTISLPKEGSHVTGGINPTRGRARLTPFTFKAIYTDPNNNAPQNMKLHTINLTTGVSLSEVEMQKISLGTESSSDGGFVNGEAYVTSDIFYEIGDYAYYFTAIDSGGNALRVPENGMLDFGVIPSTYTYIPKYKFGTENGDGNDWQAWEFNGSYIYDWSNTYVDNYLQQKFKIQNLTSPAWCSNCLQLGVFKNDPQQGFEISDLIFSAVLDGNPQNNMDQKIYDVTVGWDANGYTYEARNGSYIFAAGHTDIANINNDSWVGWDSSHNNFRNFPSGFWVGVVHPSIYYPFSLNLNGGSNMVLQPYPIYKYSGPPRSSLKAISVFDFNSLTPSVTGVIDETTHTVSLTVPFETDVTALVPTITISANASISPLSTVAQDFSSSVVYTVTAENGSTQSYDVVVIISSESTPSLLSAAVTSTKIVDLTFSEDLDGRTITNADFTITGHMLDRAFDAFEVTPGVVRLTILDVFTGGETPEIIYNTTVSNGVKDLDGYTAPAKTVIATNGLT